MTDWNEWHASYDDPASQLSRRLRLIQELIEGWLDRTAPKPVRVLSVCAGDGRDLLQVLRRRADADRVTATLLEYDDKNVARAQAWAAETNARIEVRQVDAGQGGAYEGAVPADLVLLAGVFGNISDEDVRAVIRALPSMCSDDALVIWTRHRRAPDLTGSIRSWLAAEGFVEESFTAPRAAMFTVGAHRFDGTTETWVRDRELFRFTR
ncbi:MAG TPA: class I SAM-dependent methyltransferase [Kribbella sp.]|nr:class I SAM-dependent methyltransferase [Kribbella sp.]